MLELKQYVRNGAFFCSKGYDLITHYNGQPPNKVILVLEGKCRRKLQLGPHRILYENYFPFSFIGLEDHLLGFSRKGKVGSYANAHYCLWDVEDFLQAVKIHPEVARKAIFEFSRRIRLYYAQETGSQLETEEQVEELNPENYEEEFYNMLMDANFPDEEEFSADITSHLLRIFPPGEYLLRQGEKSYDLYLIRQGKVRISQKTDYGQKELSILGEGEIFGEMAQFDGLPRSADVVALDRTEVLVFTPENFYLLFRLYPYWATKILTTLAKRLEQHRLTFETMDLAELKCHK